MINEEKKGGAKDACYHKVKSRYDVWPSAYASGALVKCRKVGAKNWGSKKEDMDFYNSVCNYLIEEGFAADVEGANSVILKLNDDILNDIYERKMTKGERTKETKLKGKYDDSGMKASMIQQYGPVKGPQVYFATIRKQAMEEVEVEEGFKSIDKDKENRMYRRAGNLARQSLASKGKKKYEAAKKSANIVSAITRQKENERFAKMADEKARDNYGESFDHPINPQKHKAAQKDKKIRNMTQSPNENEAAVAKKKAKGPKLFGEAKKGMSKDEMSSVLKGHKYSKKQLLDMSKKSTKEGRHGEASAFYAEFEKEEFDINPAVDYFFSEGINEDGLEMIIQEVGLEKFVEFVEHFSDQQILTEARAAKKARKGAKSYAEVKAEIDAKEKAKRAKREISVDKGTKAVETAKAKQPEKKPVRDAIARGVFRAVDAYKKGMERHNAAMATAKKAGKVVGAIAKEIPSGVKTAGKAVQFAHAVATRKEEVEIAEGDKYDDVGKQAARMSLLNNPGPRSTPEQTAEKKSRLEKKRGMKLDDHPQFKKEEVDKRRAPKELLDRLNSRMPGWFADDGPNKPAYDAKQRLLKKAYEKRKRKGLEEEIVRSILDEAGRRAGESKVGQAIKKAGSAAIKAGVEKAKKDIQSLKKEEVELSEAPFQVYDMKDKVNVGKEMKNKKRARTKADKLDQEYGAYRYKVIPTGDDRPEVKYGTKKEEVEFVSEKDEKVEAKYKGAKTPYLLSKFRKEHPGSRQEKKVPGAKETEGEAAARRRGAQAERAAKHGLTSKEKKETQAREKYYSARD